MESDKETKGANQGKPAAGDPMQPPDGAVGNYLGLLGAVKKIN